MHGNACVNYAMWCFYIESDIESDISIVIWSVYSYEKVIFRRNRIFLVVKIDFRQTYHFDIIDYLLKEVILMFSKVSDVDNGYSMVEVFILILNVLFLMLKIVFSWGWK